VLSTVAEEVVDDHADNGEEEDDEAPEDLVQRWAVGLDNLNCSLVSKAAPAGKSGLKCTPGDDVENKDDKPDNTATSRSLPVRGLGGDGGSLHGKGHGELEEGGKHDLEHDDAGYGKEVVCIGIAGGEQSEWERETWAWWCGWWGL
jgi:hypothetical protein